MASSPPSSTNFRCIRSVGQFYKGGAFAVGSSPGGDDKAEAQAFLACAFRGEVRLVSMADASAIGDPILVDSEDVTALALSSDSALLYAAASDSHLIRVWDLASRTCIRSWKAHGGPVVAMACHVSGDVLATARDDKIICVWDANTGVTIHTFSGHTQSVTTIMFHTDTKRHVLFSASVDGTVRVWNLKSGNCTSLFGESFYPVKSLSLSKDGKVLISSGADKILNVWDLRNLNLKKKIPTNEVIEAASFVGAESTFIKHLGTEPANVKGKLDNYFLTVGEQGVVRIWCLESGACLFEQQLSDIATKVEGHIRIGFTSAIMLPNDHGLLCCTADQNFLLYSPGSDGGAFNLKLSRRFVGCNAGINHLKFITGENENFLAVASSSRQVHVYDCRSMSCSQVLSGHTAAIHCLDSCIFSGKKLIVTGSADNSVRLWDMENGTCIGIGKGHLGAVGSISFSKKSKNFFVSGSSDNTIRKWNWVDTPNRASDEVVIEESLVVHAHRANIYSLAISPDDQFICSGSEDHTAKVWKFPDLDSVVDLRGHKGIVWSVEFSPVNRQVITSSSDRTVKIWCCHSGSCLKTFASYKSTVSQVSFLSDGSKFVSCGADGLVKLCAVETKQCIAAYDKHVGQVSALAINKKNDMLATAGIDCIKLWSSCIVMEPTQRRAKEFTLPSSVYDDLYTYQKEGLYWMWSLHCKGKGGILADDMGMGKTRQVCAFLRGLFCSDIINTAMIIAPLSVIEGWVPNLKKVGLMNYKLYFKASAHDSELVPLKSLAENGGILLTTFEMIRNHLSLIESQGCTNWDYIFADEAHRIKNDCTKTYDTLKSIHRVRTIVITATPVQNNLKEFYTLMDFCCPGLLGDLSDFQKKYIDPISQAKYRDTAVELIKKSNKASQDLKILIKPYVLRRTKEVLQADGLLGKKHEMVVWLHLSSPQRLLVEELYKISENYRREPGMALVVSAISRRICNHPNLVSTQENDEFGDSSISKRILNHLKEEVSIEHIGLEEASCKISFTLFLVKQLLSQKLKILIFSQSPKLLELLQEALLGIVDDPGKVIRMDGRTKQRTRQELIKSFQPNDSDDKKCSKPVDSCPDIFLLTTQVGGLGLNLTNASRVIVLDPSKNPSVDDQSVDRAYRIGQTKDVIVYRLVTCGTIEEHTYREQILKGELSSTVMAEQCRRGIQKREGRVLRLPPVGGFEASFTEKQLTSIYGNTFDMDLNTDLIDLKKNELVVAITNHGLLFSLKDDMQLSDEKTRGNDKLGLKINSKLIMDEEVVHTELFREINIPKQYVCEFVGQAGKNIKNFERISGAMIQQVKDYPKHRLYSLKGSNAAIVKANNLISTFLKDADSRERSEVYIPIDKVGLVFGKGGATIQAIKDKSGAWIVPLPPDKSGKRAFELFGSRPQIALAHDLILKAAKLIHGKSVV